jgi:hypothetical protein
MAMVDYFDLWQLQPVFKLNLGHPAVRTNLLPSLFDFLRHAFTSFPFISNLGVFSNNESMRTAMCRMDIGLKLII